MRHRLIKLSGVDKKIKIILWSHGNESEMSNKTNRVQISPLNLLYVHVTEHNIFYQNRTKRLQYITKQSFNFQSWQSLTHTGKRQLQQEVWTHFTQIRKWPGLHSYFHLNGLVCRDRKKQKKTLTCLQQRACIHTHAHTYKITHTYAVTVPLAPPSYFKEHQCNWMV